MKCTDLEETFYGNESYGCNHQLLAWTGLVSVENVKILVMLASLAYLRLPSDASIPNQTDVINSCWPGLACPSFC